MLHATYPCIYVQFTDMSTQGAALHLHLIIYRNYNIVTLTTFTFVYNQSKCAYVTHMYRMRLDVNV